jgi:hypothetical protein
VGTLLVATFVVLTVVTAGLAFASYRRHARAARARSRAALNILLSEAYELTAAEETAGEQAAGAETAGADEPSTDDGVAS